MNLMKLFETQKVLDEKIVKEKGLEGRDLLAEKILALQVELGELANEWRGFKFWSENQEPRTTEICSQCSGQGEGYFSGDVYTGKKETCEKCSGFGSDDSKNPVLEEYVDCLHFILSIGNDLGCSDMKPYLVRVGDPIDMFGSVFFNITKVSVSNDNPGYKQFYFAELLSRFFGLGKSLNFDWEQIEAAYFEKNKINHARQNNGY